MWHVAKLVYPPVMKRSRTLTSILGILALSGAASLCTLSTGCASTATSDSTGQYVDDTVITTKVKSALLGDDAVKSFAISVETVKGVVQLSGFVNSAAQKDAAGRDAAAVAGVMQVRNNLIVK